MLKLTLASSVSLEASVRPVHVCSAAQLVCTIYDARDCCSDKPLLSPSHLLYAASHILDPTRLPPQFLIIAGGKDRDVPYSQAVLLKTLLAGVGVRDVRLRLYRDETHFGSLASLMRTTRYSPFFLNEIEALIRGA